MLKAELAHCNAPRPTMLVLLGVLLVLLAAPGAVFAQATSGLTGRVLDQQEAAVPGALVVLRNQQSGHFRETVSGSNGGFNFTGVDPGLYQLEVSLQGFQRFERSNLRLVVGTTDVVDVVLQIGQMEETITVTTEAPLVDLSSSETGGRVTEDELLFIPSDDRSFNDYLSLLPGVVAGDFLGQDQAMYSIDGGSNNDMTRGGQQARVPIEAIQELELITNQADAAYTSGGAVVRVVSKSGTNALHGSALFHAIDARFAANDYFSRVAGDPKPDEREHQYVGTIGGPFVRDKAHYFLSYEHYVVREAEVIRVPERPDISKTIVNPGTVYNWLGRFDHQINANNHWSVKWLHEYYPELGGGGGAGGAAETAAIQTAEDRDQAFVVEFTSVLSPTMANTFRFGVTLEDYLDSSQAFKDSRDQSSLRPTLDYDDFRLQQAWKSEGVGEHTYLASNTFNVYFPRGTGGHDIQAGVDIGWTRLRADNQSYANGMFIFSHNLAFNAADPTTFPDRFRMRLPGSAVFHDDANFAAAYVQDKWRMNRLTLNLGLRYEVEVVKVPEPVDFNPQFGSPDDYPVDRNNFAPRLGFAYQVDDLGHTAIRGGLGKYYMRTEFGWTSQYYKDGPYAESFIVDFPINGIDPGPSGGQFPTHPTLVTFPEVNQAWIAANFPAGTRQKNVGSVYLDSPDRHSPYTWQASVGVSHQLTNTMAVNVDYVSKRTYDLIVLKNLNPPLRTGTSRRDRLERPNPVVFGEEYLSDVFTPVNVGKNQFDGLTVEFRKNYAQNYSFRAAYTLGYSRGNANQDSDSDWQLGDDLRLDLGQSPLGNDRRHNLVVNAMVRVPYTGGLQLSGVLRATSGTSFTITDSNFDPDRNGIFQEPAAAGTYTVTAPTGTFDVDFDGTQRGGRWPSTHQIDLRFAYNFDLRNQRNLNFYVDFVNIDNHIEWRETSFDMRNRSFLVINRLRNNPRQFVLGARYSF